MRRTSMYNRASALRTAAGSECRVDVRWNVKAASQNFVTRTHFRVQTKDTMLPRFNQNVDISISR
jgi:hypothetical protein